VGLSLSSFICKNTNVLGREAKAELGEEVFARLKLSEDGTKVLWPQPTDNSEDPQNASLTLILVSHIGMFL
jgi:hypothetical protein